MAGHIHPHKIPTKCYKPIGQLIVGWNLTEALIASIIWHIHKIKDVKKGRVLIYGLRAGDKLKILAVSAKHFTKSPAIQNELIQLQKRASAMNVERNMLSHGLWGRMPKERIWRVFNMQEIDHETLLLKRKDINVTDVVCMAQGIRTLNSDLKKFMTRNRIPPP